MLDFDFNPETQDAIEAIINNCDEDLVTELFMDAQNQMDNTIGTLEITEEEVGILLMISKVMKDYLNNGEGDLPQETLDDITITFEAIADQLMVEGIPLDSNPFSGKDLFEGTMYLRLNPNQYITLARCLNALVDTLIMSPVIVMFEDVVMMAKRFIDSIEGYGHWLITRAAALSYDSTELVEKALEQLAEMDEEDE